MKFLNYFFFRRIEAFNVDSHIAIGTENSCLKAFDSHLQIRFGLNIEDPCKLSQTGPQFRSGRSDRIGNLYAAIKSF